MLLTNLITISLISFNSILAAPNYLADGINQLTLNNPIKTLTRWEWNDCGSPGDAIIIKSLTVSPDPPRPGHNLTIFATGTVVDLVDQGSYADVTVKLGLIKLLTKRFDVCDELAGANSTLQCPITPDDYSIEQTVDLPAEIPRAKFMVQARAFTSTDAPMACIDISINFLIPDA